MPFYSETDLPLATEDEVLRDENLGIDRHIKAGQRVPADLLEAYEAKHGQTEESKAVEKAEQEEADRIAERDEETLKAQRRPSVDKTQKGPAKSKSSS